MTASTPVRRGNAEGIRFLYIGAAVVICLIGMYYVRDIIAPVFLAITLVVTARPLVLRLNDRGWPKVLSMFTGMIAVFLVLGFIAGAVLFAIFQLVTTLPEFSDEATAVIQQVSAWLTSIGVSQETIQPLLDDLNFGRLIALIAGFLRGISGGAVFLGTVLLFVAFISIDMLDTKERREALAAVRPNLSAALLDFSWRVRQYWIVNTIFALVVALIDVGILLWLNIPLALTWGILSFVSSYIPNVGFIIGMIPPAIMALLAHGWETMVTLILAYTAINFTADMLVQPKITGDAVGLNITTTFVSLLIWALVLGPMGAVLAVPLTVFFKCVLFDPEIRTRWMSIFMGGELDGVVPPGAVPPTESPPAPEEPESIVVDEAEPAPDEPPADSTKPEPPATT